MKSKILEKLKDNFPIPFFIVIKSSEHIPKYQVDKNKKYAVRSSANCEDNAKYSWAGMFDSYMNVSPIDIKEKIKLVRKSVNNKRAKIYAKKIGYKKKIKMDVIIQEMVTGTSGICFTKPMIFEPEPQNKRKLIKICKSIEKYLKKPQNIEWIRSNNGDFYILQARPITK